MFRDLMETHQRQGMIHSFFAQRAVSNLSALTEIPPRAVEWPRMTPCCTMHCAWLSDMTR